MKHKSKEKVINGLAPILILVSIIFTVYCLHAIAKWIATGERITDSWELESPGALRLKGTEYQITISTDGRRCDSKGPGGFADWGFSVDGCKRDIYRNRANREKMGIATQS